MTTDGLYSNPGGNNFSAKKATTLGYANRQHAQLLCLLHFRSTSISYSSLRSFSLSSSVVRETSWSFRFSQPASRFYSGGWTFFTGCRSIPGKHIRPCFLSHSDPPTIPSSSSLCLPSMVTISNRAFHPNHRQ